MTNVRLTHVGGPTTLIEVDAHYRNGFGVPRMPARTERRT
jgi:hypothetical protein